MIYSSTGEHVVFDVINLETYRYGPSAFIRVEIDAKPAYRSCHLYRLIHVETHKLSPPRMPLAPSSQRVNIWYHHTLTPMTVEESGMAFFIFCRLRAVSRSEARIDQTMAGLQFFHNIRVFSKRGRKKIRDADYLTLRTVERKIGGVRKRRKGEGQTFGWVFANPVTTSIC